MGGFSLHFLLFLTRTMFGTIALVLTKDLILFLTLGFPSFILTLPPLVVLTNGFALPACLGNFGKKKPSQVYSEQ